MLTTIGEGLGRFVVSPGFGGLAVFVGGFLAYRAAARQSTDARVRARDEREVARQDRWWSTLTWVYDRLTAERPEARLRQAQAVELFDRLTREAQTVLEKRTALGLLAAFQDGAGTAEDTETP